MSGDASDGPVPVAAGGGDAPAVQVPFSWLDPHPIFVIVLVGADEQPFGIQKDFLCAKSIYYREHFQSSNQAEAIEHIVKLPDTPAEVFSYAQNYLFTGRVFSNLDNMPSYEVLIGVWKLGHNLGIEGLCDATLEAMAECRRITNHIPATPLLVQVWKDTPEGSSIRRLLLSWATEYMRSSDLRQDFARSLPQEILSELVVAISSLDAAASAVEITGARALPPQHHRRTLNDDNDSDDANGPPAKKQRHSDVLPNGAAPPAFKGGVNRKPAAGRTSLPGPKPGGKRRSNVAFAADHQFTAAQKLSFCADLLNRMLSGPGFWTRLVGPFREPVDPMQDGVPNYFEKVKRPMDLGTMRDKMARGEYGDDEEFLADMNQIFDNCYTYWTKKDPMYSACEKLQKTFEEKYAQMNKWLAKMEGDEGN